MFLSKRYLSSLSLSIVVFLPRPKENDLVALYRDTKWFRGRCLTSTDTHVNVLCIDSGVVIDCARTGESTSLEYKRLNLIVG